LIGLDHIRAVTDALAELEVPILLDVDIGHLPPMIPLISGSCARVRYNPESDEFRLKMIQK
jgi:muramoyltetrapeptide carboxypeptidase LdcA involved in peptidoglycan recycling